MSQPPAPYRRNSEIGPGAALPPGITRWALAVEYAGARYHGWQTQAHDPHTVQHQLEQVLSRVADEPITVACAGRTDAGVSATGQIIHFDTAAERPAKAWVLGGNQQLPDDIAVRWAQPVPGQFHARFSARYRRYRYLISNTPTRPALFHQGLTWVRRPLDVAAMAEAAAPLCGEHDFSAFRASQCQAKSPVRTIDHLALARRGDLVVVEVQANAFLHHMVRNIVGCLLPVGKGERPPSWVAEVLASGDRRQGGATAPANGLYLVGVGYPDSFALPQHPPGPALVPEPWGALARSAG